MATLRHRWSILVGWRHPARMLSNTLLLLPGQFITLSHFRRFQVCVLSSRLWITEPGLLSDFFVTAASGAYEIQTAGPTLLENDSDENAVIALTDVGR